MRLSVLSLILISIMLAGCMGLEAPTPKRFIPPLSGASPLHLGASKDFVRSEWGDPEYINTLGVDEVGLVKEEWVYAGRKLPVIEIEPKMLVTSPNLIFTGNALTGYSKKDSDR